MNDLPKSALRDVKLFPYWLDSEAAPPVEQHLIGKTDCDVLVVGGGFTGLWGAVQAKQQNPGRDVVLIEQGKVAYGASGRPGGIYSTSVMHGLSNAIAIFPKDLDELERLGQENAEGFRQTLEQFEIDCHADWGGELTVAVSVDHLEALKEEHRLHVEHGHDALLLDAEQTRAQVNSPLYQGAVWNRHASGTVHPALLAWGLKRAALELVGAALRADPHGADRRRGQQPAGPDPSRTGSRAQGVAGHQRLCRRPSEDRLAGGRHPRPHRDDRAAVRRADGPDRLAQQAGRLRYPDPVELFPADRDNRILFGGRLGYFFNNDTDPASDRFSSAVFERLAGAFFRTFPQLDDLRFSHAWSGPIGLTTRMAVHFQRYYGDKAIYAGGYSGFGLSGSRFGARIALAMLDGLDDPALKMDFATTLPNWIPPEPFRFLGARITMHALDTLDEKGGWRHPWLRLVKALGFPVS